MTEATPTPAAAAGATYGEHGWRSEMLEALLRRLDTDQLVRLVGGIKELREAILTHGTDLPMEAAGPGPGEETARQ